MCARVVGGGGPEGREVGETAGSGPGAVRSWAPRRRRMRQHSFAGEAAPALCTTTTTGFDQRIDGRGPGRPRRRAPPQLPLAPTLPPLHLARLLPARHLGK